MNKKLNVLEYNTIHQQDYLGSKFGEDDIDRVLNAFGEEGWELIGWFGVWLIFKRIKEK